MNLQFYSEKLFASEKFQNFVKENPEAYFCSGFIIIDKEGKDNKVHVDYFVPETEKMFSFQLEKEVELIPVENQKFSELVKPKDVRKTPNRVSDNVDFEFDYVEKLIFDEMKNKEIKNKIQKILISLQSLEGKNFLLCTVFLSGLGLLKVNIDLDKKELTEFEKKSFFDLMKVVRKK